MCVVEVYRQRLFIWTEGETKLERFSQRLNTFHPNLKLTHEKSKASIKFLDVAFRINGDKFGTDLYSKPTDLSSVS